MPNTRLPNSIFFALVALGAAQVSFYTPRIPELLGSHFSRGGFVNGWQTKAAFFATELAMIILATVVSFGIPRIIAAAPVALINLPHKEYWLAPERREDTLAYIRVWSAWFGCGQIDQRDRKSTRLNSSHTVISYAVFCLKKKKSSQVNSLTS